MRQGQGRRSEVLRALELLREYAEHNDGVYAVASFLLGWLRYAENPALARGLFLKAIERGYPVTSVARNNLAVAQIGGKVLTERVDHILDADGKPAMSIPVMGIFETQDGKITAWRDYFDTAGFAGAGQ